MTPPALRIARLEEGHAGAFHSVIDSVAREGLYLAMLQAPSLEDVRKFICESVEKGRPQRGAFEGDTLVGWCDVIEKPRETLKHSGVLGIGVLTAHRGHGIGTALLEATLADARAKGFKRVELTVRTDNTRAKKLYDRFGFAVEGVCRRHMRVNGEYKDSYLMAVLYD